MIIFLFFHCSKIQLKIDTKTQVITIPMNYGCSKLCYGYNLLPKWNRKAATQCCCPGVQRESNAEDNSNYQPVQCQSKSRRKSRVLPSEIIRKIGHLFAQSVCRSTRIRRKREISGGTGVQFEQFVFTRFRISLFK